MFKRIPYLPEHRLGPTVRARLPDQAHGAHSAASALVMDDTAALDEL